jgi:hypothetical protein
MLIQGENNQLFICCGNEHVLFEDEQTLESSSVL